MNAVIESPKGGRNKFTYEPERGLFRLSKVLSAGATFPFDMGFLPSTRGEDGDPLDVLVLMDEPVFPGCLVEARLISVAAVALSYQSIEAQDYLEESTVAEVEQFFVSYNALAGKEFKPARRGGPERARASLEDGQRRHTEK